MVNAVIRWCLEEHLSDAAADRRALRRRLPGPITRTPVDAIPDIGEKQVIVYADWPGRSPQDVDDQVTYPLTTSLTGTPGVKAIRSMSGFGFSMVFVIFKDEVDYYWARSRVLERMNVAQQRLPAGVVPVLGPDATALGQVYWYTVEGEGFDLAELRSIQDWYIRYQLQSVDGVSEVASIGGFVKQYQIDLHPDKMRAHRVTLMDVLRGRPQEQHRRRRQGASRTADRVLHPRRRVRQDRRGPGEDRHPPGGRHAGPRPERGDRAAGPGLPPRGARQGRRRGRRRRGAHALRREPARCRASGSRRRSPSWSPACRARRSPMAASPRSGSCPSTTARPSWRRPSTR